MNENDFLALVTVAFILLIVSGIFFIVWITEPKKKKDKVIKKVVHCKGPLIANNVIKRSMEVKLSDVLFAVERIAMANNAQVFHASAHMSAGYNVVFKAFIYGLGDVQGGSIEEIKEKFLALKPIKKTVENQTTIITVKPVQSTPTVEPIKPAVFTEVLVDTYK